MNSGGLRGKTVHGLYWSAFELIGQQGMHFVITIVLARLLMPHEFGLIAMLALFTAVAQSFVDSGFGSALIQKQDVTFVDECSVFYLNIVLGVTSALLLSASAPWIAAFYGQPLLVPLTRVLSLSLVISAFRIIQTRILIKRLDFKAQFKVNAIATPCSGAIGIAMAYSGFGVWSLVAQSLTSSVMQTSLLWWLVGWRPGLHFSLKSIRTLFRFGSNLLLSGLIDTVFNNVYPLVIGRVFSATELGYYARAKATQQLPAQSLHSAVSRVLFPVFSSVQHDKARLKRGVREALQTLALFNFPIMVGLGVTAEPFVRVVLSEKWLPSVPYLQLLCVVGLLYPLHAINLNVLKAQGRSDLFLRLEVLKKILVIVAISITWRWGIIAMILGQITTSCLGYYLNCYFTGKLLGYPLSQQLRDIFPVLVLSLLMGLAVVGVGQISIRHDGLLLLVQVFTGVVVFAALCRVAKLPSFLRIESMLLGRLGLSRGSE